MRNALIAGPISAAFSNDAVALSGLTPRGEVYVFSVARELQGGFTRIVEREALLPASDEGAARFVATGGVPHRSVWLIVDMATNSTAVVAPDGYPFPRLDAQTALGDVPTSGAQTISGSGTIIWFVILRKEHGIWRTFVVDGDVDAMTGERIDLDPGPLVTVATRRLERRLTTTEDAPGYLQTGDIVYAFDSFNARYILTQVAPPVPEMGLGLRVLLLLIIAAFATWRLRV